MILCITAIVALYVIGALLMAVFLVEKQGQDYCEENKALTLFQCAIWPFLIAGLFIATFFID